MSLPVVPKDQIDAFRQEFLQELPSIAREYIDTARAEATTAAFEKVVNSALKVIEGLEVEKKKDVYANLPVIHVSFGPGMQMATSVEAAAPQPDAAAADVTDVEPKQVQSPFKTSTHDWSVPDDPTELLPALDAPAGEEGDDEVLNALSLASTALAMD